MSYPDVALSIRQPWAHRILHEGKDVENRQWRTRFRGPVLIHAGKGVDPDDRADVTPEMPRGGIVGIAEIVDCVTEMDSKWFSGRYGLVLRYASPLVFMPCKGALGFFKPDILLSGLRPLTSECDPASGRLPDESNVEYARRVGLSTSWIDD